MIGGVVGAGLTLGNLTLDPVSFVTQMYANGAQGYFDAISFHPYNYSVKFSAGPANTWPGTSALAQLQAIRALMNVKGDADLKIWISEYGQPTVSGTAADLQKQADFMEDMIRSWQKFLNGGPIFIYNVKDTGPANSTNTEHHFGLFDYSWNEKAAADVIRKLILELTGPKPTNPTKPKPQTGLAAFAHQLASMVATIINFVPMTAMAMMKAVKNLLGGIFGIAKVATAAARVAAASSEADTTSAVTAESVEKATDVGESASARTATTVKHETTTATSALADTKAEEKPASTDVDSEATSTTADPRGRGGSDRAGNRGERGCDRAGDRGDRAEGLHHNGTRDFHRDGVGNRDQHRHSGCQRSEDCGRAGSEARHQAGYQVREHVGHQDRHRHQVRDEDRSGVHRRGIAEDRRRQG